MCEPLTVRDFGPLADVFDAAMCNRKVARAMPDGLGGVLEGTARSIGDQVGYFAQPKDDVRDCYLRVTLITGLDVYWPVRDLMDEYREGLFVVRAE